MLSIILNGTLGLSMILATLFCLSDIDAALNTDTGYPFMEIFRQATHSTAGATIMASIITVLGLCSAVGLLASASRMSWSFARDRGRPGWRILQRVDPRTSVPIWSIAVTTIIACLLAFINLGSTVAFNDAISVTVASLNSLYLIASSLLLYRRCRGDIKLGTDSDSSDELVNTAGGQLVWGPWRIPGILGIVVNAFACSYLVIILFFSFWPPATPVTAASMNFSSLVTGAVVILGVVYYAIWGRKVYTGPVIETEQKPTGIYR
jgi:choline transport protein